MRRNIHPSVLCQSRQGYLFLRNDTGEEHLSQPDRYAGNLKPP